MTIRHDEAVPQNGTGRSKILVLSGTTPGALGVGSLLLRDCCEAMHSDRLVFCVYGPDWDHAEARRNEFVDHAWIRRYETAYRPVRGPVGEVAGAVAFRSVAGHYARRLARQTVEAVRGAKPRALWAILDSPITILVARHVARRLRLPIHTLVMDAPEHICSQLYHDRFTTRYVKRVFSSLMRETVRCGVAGESMKRQYEQEFGVPCFILRQGAVPSESAKMIVASPDRFVIGFAGTMTASDTFASLIRALDKAGWTLGRRAVVLRLVGGHHRLRARTPQHIEYYGWRSREDANRLLSECDVLYLPQTFSDARRLFAELSFPNKLSTYLGAGRPVLLHAPDHASLVRFLEEFGFGTHCNSLHESRLLAALSALDADEGLCRALVEGGRRAIAEELNHATLRRNCRALLGQIEPAGELER